jgi:aspartate 1-decarboxylase
MEEANLFVGQKVDIVNINNGERFSTYVIKGKRGKRDICLNGAAARKVHPGDKIIIIAYASMTLEEAKEFKPSVVIVDDNNNVVEKTTYLQEE